MLPPDFSALIDGGDPAGCPDGLGGWITEDQRHLPRPADGDSDGVSPCDIGAVEVQAPGGPDADGDTMPDAGDCAPTDPSAMRLPGEPQLIALKAPATGNAVLYWTDESPLAGTGTRYDVASELVSVLRSTRVADAPCIQRDLAALTHGDSRPVTDDAWYYLVRATNACGPAAQQCWGRDSLGTERPACP